MMPPGARKRKSAKKNNQTGAPNINPGNDEMKRQDSDGEEFGTPAVGFHQTSFEAGEFSTPAVDFHQTPFQVSADELDNTASSSIGVGSLTKSMVMEEPTHNGETFLEAVPDLESPGNAKSHDKDGASSSDDESRVAEKQGKGEGFGNMVSKEVGKLKEIATVGGNALVSDVVSHVKDYVPTHPSAALHPIGSVLKQNGDKLMAKFGDLTKPSPALDPQSNNNGEASSNTVKFRPQDSETKAVSSSRLPNNEINDGAQHTNTSETAQNPENEPLLSVSPRQEQTTSWKSCCGLFELCTRSNR